MPSILAPLAVRVARGATRLDVRLPGWATLLSAPETLTEPVDIAVWLLGQLYGDVELGRRSLFNHDGEQITYGLALHPVQDRGADAGVELRACWYAEIVRRRGPAGDPLPATQPLPGPVPPAATKPAEPPPASHAPTAAHPTPRHARG